MSEPCRTLYLIRHGLVDPLYRGRFIGATDVALSAEGEAQMAAFTKCHGRLLERIGRVHVSPLGRCQRSASLLFAGYSGLPILTEEPLREMNFGAWEGKTPDDIAQQDGEAWRQWLSHPWPVTFPGGESGESFAARIMRFCDHGLADMPEHCAIVAHAGVIRLMVLHLAGIALDHQFALACDPSSLTVMRLYGGNKGVLQRLNDTSHLADQGE